MRCRRDVLKPFEENREFLRDRVSSGIEMYRKAWASISVQDQKGNPVRNVHLKIRQKNHDFRYGANLFMLEEFSSEEQNAAYRTLFADAFNMATLPFYWSDLEAEQGKPRFAKDSPKVYRRPAPDLCLEYCESRGIEPKAHCLNYASFTPEWAKGTVEKEKRLLLKRFRELAERYAARIPSWEVTNETWWGFRNPRQTAFYDQPDFVEWSFEQADRCFPANRLIINEAHCNIWDDAHFHGNRSPYYMQIERALLKGSRIDSIGMQFHMFYRAEDEAKETAVFYNPRRIYDVLDTYAALGRRIQITELTIPAYAYTAEDEEIQAEIIRNLYSIWFSHPAMEAILYWNLVDGFAAFAPQGDMSCGENYYHGGLIRYDFTPKPAYQVIRELFGKTWRTELEMNTGDAGRVEFKGFYGEYKLELSVEGKTVTRSIHLERECSPKFTVTV